MILAALSFISLLHAAAPCTRVSRAGTELRGDTKICPGRYRIADPGQKGVLIVAADPNGAGPAAAGAPRPGRWYIPRPPPEVPRCRRATQRRPVS